MAKVSKVSKSNPPTVKEVSYTRRYNLGNYEHEETSLKAEVEEGGNAVWAISQLREMIEESRTITSTDVVETDVEDGEVLLEEETEAEETPAPKKKKGKKAPPPPVEEDEDEEESIVEDEDDEEVLEEEIEESDEAEAPRSKSKAPAKKTFKKKGTEYDRTNDTHKKLMAEVANEVMGKGWIAKNTGRAKTCSVSLNGKPFLDAEGEVLPEFKAAFKKIAKSGV